jgi:spore germination cell wall hydrolase CwlJ-like protein
MNRKVRIALMIPPVLMIVVLCAALVRFVSKGDVAPKPKIVAADGFDDAEIRAQVNDDAYVVALTIFAEAKGETPEGRLAVASVIWNRAHGHKDMLAEVCLMNKQFSCWNGKAGEKLLSLDESKLNKKESAIFQECLKVARDMMDGKFVPQVTATHYHSKDVNPKWARQMTKVAVIGRHIFYKA